MISRHSMTYRVVTSWSDVMSDSRSSRSNLITKDVSQMKEPTHIQDNKNCGRGNNVVHYLSCL